jgi:hypothetical protein
MQELAEGAAVGLPLNAPARSQVRATGQTHMRALTIWHRKQDGQAWEVLTENMTGRPMLFFGFDVALVYALRSSDERLRYQFRIEGGPDGNPMP